MTQLHSLSVLEKHDPFVAHSIQQEQIRELEGLELIASENYVSPAVLAAQGSLLTHKYAEGYPHKRYYGGCEYVDQIEELAIQRATQLFQAEAANVQPHSGSQANMATYLALLSLGDPLMGMELSQGGHLTHGSPMNFSGKFYKILSYGVDPQTHLLDYDRIREQVKREKPKVLVAGASAYPRTIDFNALGSIAKETQCALVADIAHIAGLVATGLHPSPIPHATYTTTTTHKTLRGPRGGMILCAQEHLKAINSAVFPGIQGGPAMHVIAAKAVALGEALQPSFRMYQKQILMNAQALANELMALGFHLVSHGTDTHLLLIDLTHWENNSISGKDAQAWLDQAGITVNKNTIPDDKRSPLVTSGIRIGVPAITTRGMKTHDMKPIAAWIQQSLLTRGDTLQLSKLKQTVKEFCQNFPLYHS